MKKTSNVCTEELKEIQEVSPIDTQQEKIRALVGCIYDMQKMRISCGNRLVASFKSLGDKSREREKEANNQIKSGKPMTDEEMKRAEDKERDSMLKEIMTEYNRITDAFADKAESRKITDSKVKKAIEEANKTGKLELIGSIYEFRLAETYNSLLRTEQQATSALEVEVKKHPMWDRFFADVVGCGPLMAAVCLSYFDVHKARHPSSFWKYAGLDVVNGEGRSRRHTEEREYLSKDQKIEKKMGLTFNPTLKTKLVGVLGPCIIKLSREKKVKGSDVSGAPIGYAKMYYDYKERISNRMNDYTNIFNGITDNDGKVIPTDKALRVINNIYKPVGWIHATGFEIDANGVLVLTMSDGSIAEIKNNQYSDLHKHRMAMRYMMKQFVRDLWISWRTYEGYDIGNPYYEQAKLGHKPHLYNEAYAKAE